MNILVSGAGGLIGSALVDLLTSTGEDVVRLVRSARTAQRKEIRWDPVVGQINSADLQGVDAIIHLAGENIGAKRWTAARKAVLRASRIQGTRLICRAAASLKRKPQVVLLASAVGYYGDRGEEVLDETSRAGTGFLAELCRDWEAATEPAAQAGIRVVLLRFGIVLSRSGGALPRMLTPFRLGFGGRLGNGHQYMSWISLDDAIRAIYHCLIHEELRGPVNIVTPDAVTNRQFTKFLGSVLKRPTIFPVPGALLRLAVGEIANDLLASTRVRPSRLIATDFTFDYPELKPVLKRECR